MLQLEEWRVANIKVFDRGIRLKENNSSIWELNSPSQNLSSCVIKGK